MLVRANAPSSTLGAVLSILARALGLSGATIVYEIGEGVQALSIDDGSGIAPASRVHDPRILAAYRYLAGSNRAPSNDTTHLRPSGKDLLPAMSPDTRHIVLPLVVRVGRAFGAVQLSGDASLDEVDLAFANMIVTELALALDRARTAAAELMALATRDADLLRNEHTRRFLSHLSTVLADADDDGRSVLPIVVELVVRYLCDGCFVDEIAEDGTVVPLMLGLTDESVEQLRTALLPAFTPHSAGHEPRTGVLAPARSLLIPDVSPLAVPLPPGLDERRDARARSLMAVKLEAHGRLLGTMTFVGNQSRRPFDARDLRLAEETAHRLAAAIAHDRRVQWLQRALFEQQEVLPVVCHELRQPLSAMSVGLHLMLQHPAASDRRRSRKALEALERSASRMGELVKDLVDASSLDAGHASIRRDWHSLSSLVAEALEAQISSSSCKRVSLRFEIPTEPIHIFCDRERTLQVLANLLGNAIKFTPDEGEIALAVRSDEHETTFSVADNGRGIAPADLPHVFDRYWRTFTDNEEGTGLGLYISKRIVDAHGGRIWVESQLGQWSVFSFTIPHGPPGPPSSAPND
jgi:signal transduction histidine kinase